VVAPNAVSYRILDSRSADAAKEVLGDYAGTILCDGYSAYEALQKKSGRFRLAHCWAHVRRKFVDIEEQFPDLCREILDLIGELYALESSAKSLEPEARRSLRQAHSKPVVQRIHDWALRTETLPQSSLGKAIAYMGGIWDGLRVFLDDPNVNIDNNG